MTALTRAYSLLDIKTINEDQRTITGIATTVSTDLMDDVVESSGAEFQLPIPFLWQHRSDSPVGSVTKAKVTKTGIEVEVHIQKTDVPGLVKDRLDACWEEIRLRLVRGLSIGFKGIETARIEGTYGTRFIKWLWLELSGVTIPANSDCSIQTIKSVDVSLRRKDMGEMQMPTPAAGESQPAFMSRCTNHMLNCSEGMSLNEASAHCAVNWDNRQTPQKGAATSSQKTIDNAQRAASGQSLSFDKLLPGVTGTQKTTIIKAKEAKTVPKTIAEQISAFEATRMAKDARMTTIMDAAAETGETLDSDQTDEYDGLAAELKAIDAHLVRLREREKTNVAAATEVKNVTDPGVASAIRVAAVPKAAALPKGTAFTRYAIALARSKGNLMQAAEIAKGWIDSTPEVETVLKAAVAAGTTTDPNWALPLVNYNIMASEFIEFLRPLTIIGRIPGLRNVPFNIKMPAQASGSSVGWVGEGAPKPVSALSFTTVTMTFAKVAGIVVLTDELVRFSNPSAEAIVRSDLAAAVANYLDIAFLDPTKAAVTGVSPASITNGVTPVTATGVDVTSLRNDLRTLMATFVAANMSVGDAVWIMSQQQALAISLILNPLGQQEFPGVSLAGGTLFGLPVIASEAVPSTGGSPTDGSLIVLAKASEIMLADDGTVTLDASREASLQMDGAPDSPATGSTIMVSLWQQNMVGLRAERYINWQKRRTGAVQFIQNAKYTG